MVYIPTHENVADIFTKALPREKFEAFREALNLSPFGDWLYSLYIMTLALQGVLELMY